MDDFDRWWQWANKPLESMLATTNHCKCYKIVIKWTVGGPDDEKKRRGNCALI